MILFPFPSGHKKAYHGIVILDIREAILGNAGHSSGSFLAIAAAALAAVLAAAAAAGPEGAAQRIPGPVPARVLRVIDGDTIVVRASIWLGQEVETKVRLAGVDTPELSGKCEYERSLARKAREFVLARIGGGEVILLDIRYGKYAGRVVARVRIGPDQELSAALIDAGLGWAGGRSRRSSWCGGQSSGGNPRRHPLTSRR